MADAACIAANVARLRLDRGLTQDQLAARAGISPTALGKIECGTVVPRARILTALAAALAAPLGELVTPGEPAGLSRHDFPEDDRLPGLVRRAVEEQRISLGRAAEILGLTREEMRKQARAWAR